MTSSDRFRCGESAFATVLRRLRRSVESPESYRTQLSVAVGALGLSSDGLARIAACDREAARLHRAQLRGDGSPYIVHPRRVALLVAAAGPPHPLEAVLIALLHDVIEDCGVATDQLARRYGERVAKGVALLSAAARPGESAAARLARKKAKWDRVRESDAEVLLVHVADALDNLVSCRFLDDHQPAARKVPRWLWQAEEFHIPLAQHSYPLIADALREEIAWQHEHGRQTGTWRHD